MPPTPGARLLLHFGAIDQTAEVYVNDRYQCTHVGGYLPFTVDITDALLGSTGNRLVVRVQDFSQTSYHARGKQTLERGGMFYTAQSGIWQTVWMEWVPKNYIRALDITPHDDLASVTVRLETNLPAGVEVAVYGDASRDGKINLGDAASMLKKIAKWDVTIDTVAADVTGDGKVNLGDVSLLLKKIAGWGVEFDPTPVVSK